MKYVIMFLVFLVVTLIIYAIYWYIPNLTDEIENRVEYYTGFSRTYLPKKLTSELSYLQFSKKTESAKENLYYFEIEPMDQKSLALIVTHKDANVMLGEETIDTVINETEISKIFSITLLPKNEIPLIVVQSITKPVLYIGNPK